MFQQVVSKTIFSFLGAPGSGKGTLARKCRKELGFSILATGDLCRKHIAEDTLIGKQIKKIIEDGHLIPDDLITVMVNEWLADQAKLEKPIILDGYPRTVNQFKLFKELLKRPEYNFNLRVILFEISNADVINRLANRLICSNKKCQAIYSLAVLPPKIDNICDSCNAKLVTRADDKHSVILERLKVFDQTKQDILNYCDSIEIKVETLSVGNKSIEEIFENFKQML